MLMTGIKKTQKVKVPDDVLCICYLMQSRKDKGKNVLALLNSRSKVNAMTLVYAAQLGLKVQKTEVTTQKINKSSLKIYGMIISVFQVFNKLDRFWFFQKTFLLTDINMEVVLGMFFITFSNVDV